MYSHLLTIQDISCVGQCSLTVALPIISSCGVECSVLPAAVLSNHTGGFSGWTCKTLTDEFNAIKTRWKKENLYFDAFYTGYLCADQIDPVLSVIESSSKPKALRFVDPAMGDNGKLYHGFEASFPREMARLCVGADYILPNLTEAALLVGREPKTEGLTREEIADLCVALGPNGLGARNVILTGVSFDDSQLGSAVFDGHTITYDFNPRLKQMAHGTGDVFAATFVGAVLRGMDALSAAALAADIVCASIASTPEGHWYGVSFERVLGDLAIRMKGIE